MPTKIIDSAPNLAVTYDVKGLILASKSPFRRALLQQAGVNCESVGAATVDEKSYLGSTPKGTAQLRAAAKTKAVAEARPDFLVIGADQVLSLGMQAFDKAQNEGEATARLRLFAGQTHTLHSAVCLMLSHHNHKDPIVLGEFTVNTIMPMRPLSEGEISAYIATGEWKGSVGCYQFENRGIHLFNDVIADQSSVIGLPLQQLLSALRELGVNLITSPHGPWKIRPI